MDKLTRFAHGGENHKVSFVETSQVCEGVTCDVYAFSNDPSRDLGIVHVDQGHRTPLQKVLLGDVTIEGYLGGRGQLYIQTEDGDGLTYTFDESHPGEARVGIGQIMQWRAAEDSGLVFYEICQPPYEEGRFENVPE